MMKNPINKKIIASALLLVVTNLPAPRSLKHEPTEPIHEQTSIENKLTTKTNSIKIDKPSTKNRANQGSLDWTVTTTKDLTESIQYIKNTLVPNETTAIEKDKKELLDSLKHKEDKTRKTINKALRKGDDAYNKASFSVNRLTMAVAWHKEALKLLNTKLSSVCAEKNLSYKDFKAMEESCKESLFYEVYAYTCSKYPDPTAQINNLELQKIVDLVVAQHTKKTESKPSTAMAINAINPVAQAQKTESNSGQTAANLWAEIKELKTKQFEQSVSHQKNIQSLQKDLAWAQNSLVNYKQTLEKASKKTAELQHSVEQVSAEKITKTIELAKLEKRLEVLEKTHKHETEKLNEQIDKLSKDLQSKEKALAKFNEQREALEHKLKSLQEALTQAKAQNLSNDIEVKYAKSKQAKAQELLKTQQLAIEKKLAKFAEQMQTKEKEVMQNRLEIKKLKKELKEKQIALMEKKLSLNSTNTSQTPPATPAESAKSTLPEVKEPSNLPSLPPTPQSLPTPSIESPASATATSAIIPSTPTPAPAISPTPEPKNPTIAKPEPIVPLLPATIATTPTHSKSEVAANQSSIFQSASNPLVPATPVEPEKPSQSLFINV